MGVDLRATGNFFQPLFFVFYFSGGTSDLEGKDNLTTPMQTTNVNSFNVQDDETIKHIERGAAIVLDMLNRPAWQATHDQYYLDAASYVTFLRSLLINHRGLTEPVGAITAEIIYDAYLAGADGWAKEHGRARIARGQPYFDNAVNAFAEKSSDEMGAIYAYLTTLMLFGLVTDPVTVIIQIAIILKGKVDAATFAGFTDRAARVDESLDYPLITAFASKVKTEYADLAKWAMTYQADANILALNALHSAKDIDALTSKATKLLSAAFAVGHSARIVTRSVTPQDYKSAMELQRAELAKHVVCADTQAVIESEAMYLNELARGVATSLVTSSDGLLHAFIYGIDCAGKREDVQVTKHVAGRRFGFDRARRLI